MNLKINQQDEDLKTQVNVLPQDHINEINDQDNVNNIETEEEKLLKKVSNINYNNYLNEPR
jgi:hypothetical protein|tara:strand:- start:31 stop:213 length:183 start_codon:yes stop_codon:yes gene_type:complete